MTAATVDRVDGDRVDTDRVDAARTLAAKFIQFLETNQPPDGLFAPDIFLDMTLPMWRLQADNPADCLAIRLGGHPIAGRVPRHRFDPTPTGFVLEVEERWSDAGQQRYCRELFRADISEAGITQLAVYCTGDWDEVQVARHEAEVSLLRP
jgi:hypothetical protein